MCIEIRAGVAALLLFLLPPPTSASTSIPAPPQQRPVVIAGADIHRIDGPVIRNGRLRKGQQVAWCRHDGSIQKVKITELMLTEGGLLAPQDNEPAHQWLTTGDPQGFTFLARRFLGPEVEQVHQAFVGRAEEAV